MQQVRPNKRQLILEEASRLLYERGTALGVDTLVEEIGVAKMTLYKHFPSKTELVVDCLRHIDELYRARLQACTDRAATPKDKILAICDSLGEWFVSPNFRGCAFINATVELADEKHPARQAILEHKRKTRRWLADLVSECGFKDGEYVARQISQVMEGAIVTALVERDPSAAEIAKTTVAQLLESCEKQ